MMLVTINNKILSLKIFSWLNILHQNQQNLNIAIMMIPLQGLVYHYPGTIFLSEIWYYAVLYHISLCLKNLNGFLMGRNSIFQNNEVENFKDVEILQSQRDFFQFSSGNNFWYIHAIELKFSTYGKESNSHRLIEKP